MSIPVIHIRGKAKKRIAKRFEDVKQNVPFWMSPDFQYVRHELKDLEIKLARCGTVAWFYCVLDDINTYKGEPASWRNGTANGSSSPSTSPSPEINEMRE